MSDTLLDEVLSVARQVTEQLGDHKPLPVSLRVYMQQHVVSVRVCSIPDCAVPRCHPDVSELECARMSEASPSDIVRSVHNTELLHSLITPNHNQPLSAGSMLDVLNVLGVPHVHNNENGTEPVLHMPVPMCNRAHSNRLLWMSDYIVTVRLMTGCCVCVMLDNEHTYDNLHSLLSYNQSMFAHNHMSLCLVVYQMLSAVRDCVCLGMLPDALSVACFCMDHRSVLRLNVLQAFGAAANTSTSTLPTQIDTLPNQNQHSTGDGMSVWLRQPLSAATNAWTRAQLSTYDYLLVLNAFAGRTHGDPNNHPIFPWVVDFTQSEGGWRDLTQTKYRLNKGDTQLDLSFAHASEHLPAHHVPELLSDIGYYLYMARRTPRHILCKHVRQQWVPAEYPVSVVRLYECSPDECIPELYSDASVFSSMHDDMSDLCLPEWTSDAQQFVNWHRGMLESEWVGVRLHKWIDLVFGCGLSGQSAIDNKNVQLTLLPCARRRQHGMLQLFTQPHPQRNTNKTTRNSKKSSQPICYEQLSNVLMNPLYELKKQAELRPLLSNSDMQLQSVLNQIYKHKECVSWCSSMDVLMQSVAVCCIQLVCPQPYTNLPPTDCTLEDRVTLTKHLLNTHSHNIPRWLHTFASCILQSHTQPLTVPHQTHIPSSVLTPASVLQPLLNVLQMPVSIPVLYEWLCADTHIIRSLHRTLLTQSHDGYLYNQFITAHQNTILLQLQYFESNTVCAQVQSMCESRVHELVRMCSAVLAHHATVQVHGVQWLMCILQHVMAHPLCTVLTVWSSFAMFSQHLSAQQTHQLFKPALHQVFDLDAKCSSKHLKMYHRTFLQQLCVRVGTECFGLEYVPLIVEAAGGLRDEHILSDTAFVQEHITHLIQGHQTNNLVQKQGTAQTVSLSALVLEHSNEHDQVTARLLQSVDMTASNATADNHSHQSIDTDTLNTNTSTAHTVTDSSSRQSESDDTGIDVAAHIANHNNPNNQNSANYSECSVSEVAYESLVWLCARFGPSLTARYVTRNVLRMLAVSYTADALNPSDRHDADDCIVLGDIRTGTLLQVLVAAAQIYGHAFIIMQYLPFCVDLVEQASKRLTAAMQSGLIACVVLVEALFPYLTDKHLMDLIQEPLIDSIVFSCVRLASSLRMCFDDNRARKVLAHKTAILLAKLGKRMGAENFKRLMAAPLQRLLCTFDVLYSLGQPPAPVHVVRRSYAEHSEHMASALVMTQLHQAFDAHMACVIYNLFLPLVGKQYLDMVVPNGAVLVCLVDEWLSASTGVHTTNKHSAHDHDFNVSDLWLRQSSSSNRLSLPAANSTAGTGTQSASASDTKCLDVSDRCLQGNWLAHWQHNLGCAESASAHNQCQFNHISLLCLYGHGAVVRRLLVMDNENSVATASADRTVRLWTLRSCGQGTHKVWDAFTGACVRELDWPSEHLSGSALSEGVSRLQTLACPNPLLAAVCSAEPVLRLCDVRSERAWVSELKHWQSNQVFGQVRALCTGDTWLAAGTSTGQVIVFDTRTGRPLSNVRLHDTAVTHITSMSSQSMAVVHANTDNVPVICAANCTVQATLKIPSSECLVELQCVREQYISLSSGQRLRLHEPTKSGQVAHVEHKVKSSVLGTVASTFAYLPLNKQFLFAGNNGNLQLFC